MKRRKKRKHTSGPSSGRNRSEQEQEEETEPGEDQVAGRDWALHNTPISETGGKALGELERCSNPQCGATTNSDCRQDSPLYPLGSRV